MQIYCYKIKSNSMGLRGSSSCSFLIVNIDLFIPFPVFFFSFCQTISVQALDFNLPPFYLSLQKGQHSLISWRVKVEGD